MSVTNSNSLTFKVKQCFLLNYKNFPEKVQIVSRQRNCLACGHV